MLRNYKYSKNLNTQIHENDLYRKTNKKIDLVLILIFILFIFPYIMSLYAIMKVFGYNSIILHIVLFMFPFLGCFTNAIYCHFVYQLLTIYLPDDELLKTINVKKYFLGNLFNPIIFGILTLIMIGYEIILFI